MYSIRRKGNSMQFHIRLLIACAGLAWAAMPTSSLAADAPEAGPPAKQVSITLPTPDSARGRTLFVTKSCVLCHSVNNVGGLAAPSLDAPQSATAVDLMRFSARMWRGASGMLSLQAQELGYTVQLEGQEIADLAAFAYDAQAQHAFSVNDVPEQMRDRLIDERYWDNNTWQKYIGRADIKKR